MNTRFGYFIIFVLLFTPVCGLTQAGVEPEIMDDVQVRTPYGEGFTNGLSFSLNLNNFGFAFGTEYRRVIAPYSELLIDFQISPLRDITEQNFQFFGQQIIPNKRNRILSFPLSIGYKQRLFPETISDNFRLYVTATGGPTLAFIYPYYQLREVFYLDIADLPAFQTGDESVINFGLLEANTGQFVNDMFQGWGDGSWQTGGAGQLALGIDFGNEFRHLSSVKIGFSFQYFSEGIQVMDPYRVLGYIPAGENFGDLFVIDEGSPKQKFFGSPFFTLTFGRMW